jgi:membrane carboxypeptidase/penicillin-binding protein
MMNMLKKLLKILLWLIGGGVLLIVLTLAGFYLYFAIPMQKNFAKLEATQSTDCTTSDHWQIFMPIETYPTRLQDMFEQLNQGSVENTLARLLIEDRPYRNLEFSTRLAVGILEIKRHYTPKERIELAMNHVYVGSYGDCHVRGMEAGTQYYFSKKPQQLSVAEMALLAGIVKGANYYNPFERPEKAQKRRDQVLKLLWDKHLITEAEYQTALKEPLPTESHLP